MFLIHFLLFFFFSYRQPFMPTIELAFINATPTSHSFLSTPSSLPLSLSFSILLLLLLFSYPLCYLFPLSIPPPPPPFYFPSSLSYSHPPPFLFLHLSLLPLPRPPLFPLLSHLGCWRTSSSSSCEIRGQHSKGVCRIFFNRNFLYTLLFFFRFQAKRIVLDWRGT